MSTRAYVSVPNAAHPEFHATGGKGVGGHITLTFREGYETTYLAMTPEQFDALLAAAEDFDRLQRNRSVEKLGEAATRFVDLRAPEMEEVASDG